MYNVLFNSSDVGGSIALQGASTSYLQDYASVNAGVPAQLQPDTYLTEFTGDAAAFYSVHAHHDDCKTSGLTELLLPPLFPPSPSAAMIWYLDDGSPTYLSRGALAPPLLTFGRSPSNVNHEGIWSSGYNYWEYNGGPGAQVRNYTANAFGTRGGCWQMITREAALLRALCGGHAHEVW